MQFREEIDDYRKRLKTLPRRRDIADDKGMQVIQRVSLAIAGAAERAWQEAKEALRRSPGRSTQSLRLKGAVDSSVRSIYNLDAPDYLSGFERDRITMQNHESAIFPLQFVDVPFENRDLVTLVAEPARGLRE